MWTLRKETIYLPCCQRIWKPCQNNIILLCNFLTLVFIAPVFGHDLWPVWWIFLLKLEFTIWDKWSIERSVYASKRGMDILHATAHLLSSSLDSIIATQRSLGPAIHSVLQIKREEKDYVRLHFPQSLLQRNYVSINSNEWQEYPAEGRHAMENMCLL